MLSGAHGETLKKHMPVSGSVCVPYVGSPLGDSLLVHAIQPEYRAISETLCRGSL